jgi:hypothetical protein
MQFKPAARGRQQASAAGFLHPPLTEKIIDEAIEDSLV